MNTVPRFLTRALVVALMSTGAASAAVITLQGTTCNGSSVIHDLSNGVYRLPGREQVHAVTVYGEGTATFMAQPTADATIFAVCTDPPSPTARCSAVNLDAGHALALPLRPTRPSTQANIWIVVDNELPQCGQYTAAVFDAGD